MTVAADRSAPQMRFPELVAFTAAVMALGALSIDIMLPALGAIGKDMATRGANDVQLVVYAFTIGYGVAQLFFGPLSDRFGRRAVLLGATAGYVLAAALSVFSSSFALLLAARMLQGVCTAAARVAIMASVRDRFSGTRMAEVASASTTIFMAAPILAPAIGQAILLAAEWQMIFAFLLVYGIALGGWAFLRMNETLPEGDRRSLRLGSIFSAFSAFAANRQSLGYTLVTMVLWGAFFAYLGTAQQIYVGAFHIGALFPLAFAAGAIPYGVAALANAMVVRRFGLRRSVHAGIAAIIAISAGHLAAAFAGGESLPVFIISVCATLFALGFVGPNATALAMEPMGKIAGAAASANGFASTTGAALIGVFIGGRFDGATTLVSAGFLAMGAIAFAIAFWTEQGKLFREVPERLEAAP
ncbi:MAG: multidrug effflux MFS transporter [Pseudomonadota bacterium]